MQAADNAASQFSLTSCFKMIAECHYASKNYAEALDILHEEQQLTEDIDPRRIRLKNLAVNCLDRARCYLQLNREDEAEECRAQAISFATRFYQEVHFEPVDWPSIHIELVDGHITVNIHFEPEDEHSRRVFPAAPHYQIPLIRIQLEPHEPLEPFAELQAATGFAFVTPNAPVSFLKRKILSIDDVPDTHPEQFVLHEFAETEKHFRPKHFKNTMDEFAQAMATWTLTRVGNDFWENHGFPFEKLLGKMERVSYFAVLKTL